MKAEIPFCYERLYTLYRKKEDYESEIYVIKTAIDVFYEKDFKLTYIDRLKKRLERTEELYEKNKGQTTLI